MKKVLFIVVLILTVTGCRNTKQSPEMMPVESNDGIGDGAPPLDSLLQYQTPPIMNRDTINKPKDTIK